MWWWRYTAKVDVAEKRRRAQVRGQGRTLLTVLTLRVSGVKSESTTRGQGGEFTMYLINMSAAV